MTGLEFALIALAILLVFILAGFPISLTMGLTGFVGTWLYLGSPAPLMAQLKTLTYDTFASYSLSIVPLFLLMGQFATKSGMARALFAAAADWLGHRKGGLAMASIAACAGFGAVCGSSLATASTMTQVALPEMRRSRYSDVLSTGVLAAGGTLGILIPPSIILVIYAILTEQNVAKMFVAALLPGILAAIGYMIVVAIFVRIKPESAPSLPRKPFGQRFKSLAGIWPVATLFLAVIGGIYTGLFNPTEGAAVGAVGTGLYGALNKQINFRILFECLLGTAQTTAMIFLILLGATILNSFLAFTQAPQMLASWIIGSGFGPYWVLIAILIFYVVFGCVMDSLSMILLTIPIFFPVIEVLDFGLTPEETAIWFGILALVVVEVGLITPPVGMNLFIIHSMAVDIPLKQTYKGAIPFVLSDLVRVGILILFPAISVTLISWV